MSKTPTATSVTVCDVLLLLERAENVEQRINYVRTKAPPQATATEMHIAWAGNRDNALLRNQLSAFIRGER